MLFFPIYYVFSGCIACLLLFFIYIRLKYRFWALQPVFHFYDVYYWFVDVGIIRTDLPSKNRYVNVKNITTKRVEEVDARQQKRVAAFLRQHYLQNQDNQFNPALDNIVPYFVGHFAPAFWSFFVEPEWLLDTKTGRTFQDDKLVGVITSRPLHVTIYQKNTFDVNYVDYLCVDRAQRKKQIAPQLIQTHEYNQSHMNKKISVSLFKREEELTGIIPLTVYKTYCFPVSRWTAPSLLLQPGATLLTGDMQNLFLVYNFLNHAQTRDKWDVTVLPEMSHFLELVKTGNLFVKMLLLHDGNVSALYLFRKTCTFLKKNEEVLSCFASIQGNSENDDFVNGFKHATWSILQKNKSFAYLTVEDVSDNAGLLENLRQKTQPILVSPMAYFFYNFAYHSFSSNKCLIVN